MSRRPSHAAIAVALLATVAGACTGGGGPTSSPSPSPVPVKIAVLQDLSSPSATQVVTPAFLGLQLAFAEAVDRGGLPVVPEVVEMDTTGDPATTLELANEIAADPSFVAVVIAPFTSQPVAAEDVLASAGVTELSLSSMEPSLANHGSSLRLVAGLRREAGSLASAVRGSPSSAGGTCVAGDGSAYSLALTPLLEARLDPHGVVATAIVASASDLAPAVARIGRAGCGVVVWAGFAPGATLLRVGLTEAGGEGEKVRLLGSSAMKADAFLATAAGDGTVVTCPCVDLGSSTRPEARRFIHDFQSQYGSSPGVYGAEGWDAAGMLLSAFGAGATSRSAVAAALAVSGFYEGLANTYRFTADGELADGSARIHTFRATGLRWVPLGESDRVTTLPVRTTGYLSVATCRKGRPFVYRDGGRLRGFDVELATAVSARLGLRLSWSDRSCDAAIRDVARGTLDLVLTPVDRVPQGTPTSAVALALHLALVTKSTVATGDGSFLQRLGSGDVVGVVRSPEVVAWARQTLPPTGATFVVVGRRRSAYDRLAAGELTAVADLEFEAWAAIERRPSLGVAESVDAGAQDVFAAKGSGAALVAAVDRALGRMLAEGRYALLFAKYFAGTPIPAETGT